MATQEGVIQLKGQIGNLSFFKTADGFQARLKGGVDGKRMRTDPAFQRTRENWSEFTRAAKAGKLVRNAVRTIIGKARDKRMVPRLTQQFVAIVKADQTNARGERLVLDSELELLSDFEFNNNGKLNQTFFAPYSKSIDRATGMLEISIPAFVPAKMLAIPEGATHVTILVAGIEINFEEQQYTVATESSDNISIGSQTEPAITLTAQLPPNSTNAIFLVLSIAFNQQVNNQMYALQNGAHNATAIVQVNSPA